MSARMVAAYRSLSASIRLTSVFRMWPLAAFSIAVSISSFVNMCKCLSVRHQRCFSHLCQQPLHVALSYIFGTPGRDHSPVVAYEQTPHYSHCSSKPSCSDWSNARRRWHCWHCRERGDLGPLPLFQPRSPVSVGCSLWQSCREVRGFFWGGAAIASRSLPLRRRAIASPFIAAAPLLRFL